MIRVAHIIYGKGYGGAEQIVLSLCREIDRGRFYPIVIVLSEGKLQESLRSTEIETHLIKMAHKFDISVLWRLVSLLKRLNVRIIHTHSVRTNLLGRLTGRLLGIFNITTIHAPFGWDTDNWKKKRFNLFLESLTVNMVDKYIAVSKVIASRVKRSVKVIYNGVEQKSVSAEEQEVFRDRFGISTDRVVGMAASFRPRKGAEIFIEAMPKILKRVPDVRFALIGDCDLAWRDDYLVSLKKMVEERGILDKVVFTGFCKEVYTAISVMDILVLPALFGEGTPLVLLEAMSLKKPIAATNIEGNREVVEDGRTGILVPAGDSEKLADAIITLLNNSAMRESMGMQGFERFEKFYTLDKMVKSYEEVYEDTNRISSA